MNKSPSVFILILLISFGAVTALLFTPGLPHIGQFFSVSSSTAELTVSIFLAGYAIGQLPYGALSNRFGRKPALNIALSLAGIGTALCIFSAKLHWFSLLLGGRLIMALGSSAGLTMTFNIITDYYTAEKCKQITSYVMLAFAIMPGFSIMVGGFLVEHFLWVSCFYFLLGYCIALFFIINRLPETCVVKDASATGLSSIKAHYLSALKDETLIIFAIMAGCATAYTYVFTTKAPFVALDYLHLSPAVYGLLNVFPAVGMLLGSLLSARFSTVWGTAGTMKRGLFMMGAGTGVMLFSFLTHYVNTTTLIFPMLIINIGLVMVYTHVTLQGLKDAKNRAVHSSILSCINIGICFLVITALKTVPNTKMMALPLSFSALFTIIFLLYRSQRFLLN